MSEEALVRRAQEGDDAAFDALVVSALPGTYRFLRGLGASQEDAEDAAQEAFVRAWKALKRFDAARPFKPWLYQIAKNAYRDMARRRRAIPASDLAREYVSDDASDAMDTMREFSDPAPLPDELFASEESRTQVRAALAELAPGEQNILSLRYDAGFSFEEIAETLEKPAGTIRSIHHRALARLRRMLAPHDPESS